MSKSIYLPRFVRCCLAVASVASVACTKSQRTAADSAGGNVATSVPTALAVIDVDLGRHVDGDNKVTDKTDDFAPSDTIFASVHTSGTATNGPVVGRWTYQDGTVVDEKTDSVTTNNTARTAFFITKTGGLPAGKYTLHVLINGTEVRAKDATVK